MIAVMRERDFLRDDRVEQAFRSVPRHVFAPEVSWEEAYDAEGVVRTKYDEYGATISSVSAPYIQAMMLKQANIRPGDRVLEIGSGGCNAALIAELTGERGVVTTVDIDSDIVDRARSCLDEAGYPQVTVLCADAEDELPQDGAYDRIIVTAGCWDIPRSWSDRLAAGGRLVVPLRLRELTRSVALEHAGDHWSGTDHQMCGFVAMQGQGAHHANTVRLYEDVWLRVDDELPIDVDGLHAAVSEPPVQVCTGVEVASQEPFDGLHLWLITALPRVAKFSIEQRVIDDGWLTGMARFSLVLVEGASFAYHAESRLNGEKTRYEFVVHAHGPDAARLAKEYANLIRTWSRSYRAQQPRIDVHPAGATVATGPASRVIDKHDTRIALHWPEPARGDELSTYVE